MDGVSFVITVFNKADEIEAVAAALFAQAGDFAREFIFVDDGSTDGSPAILARLAAQRPDVRVLTRANGGPASALNAGVRAARHPLVKPVDGDDVLARDAVLTLAQGLAAGAVLALGGKVVLSAAANPATLSRASAPVFTVIDDALRLAIDASLSGCSEVLVRRDAFLAVGGCDERLFIQDQSYLRRLAARGYRIARTDAVVVFSPPSGADALCRDVPQIDHDNNASLMYLLGDEPGLGRAIRRLALRKCASRAWKFARRVQRKRLGADPAFWAYMLSYVPLVSARPGLFRATLRPYLRTGRVRRP